MYSYQVIIHKKSICIGGAVCFQPVYLYVEGNISIYVHIRLCYFIVGPPLPVKIYDTIVT